MNGQQEIQRHFPRIKNVLLVEISRFDEKGFRADMATGRTFDISYGGLRLAPNDRLSVGQPLRLEVNGLGPLSGTVVRVADDYCGLRLDLEEDECERVKSFVDQLRDAA